MKCPVIKAIYVIKGYPQQGSGDCLKEDCAWWVGQMCAVVKLAQSLANISEHGIAIDKREE